jgi:FdhD protein
MSDAGLEAATVVTAIDEYGQLRQGHIAGERALTVYLKRCRRYRL